MRTSIGLLLSIGAIVLTGALLTVGGLGVLWLMHNTPSVPALDMQGHWAGVFWLGVILAGLAVSLFDR